MFMSIHHPDSMYYHIYDILSQSEIHGCVWADDEKGIYCRYKRNKIDPEQWLIKNNDMVTEIRRGKIKLIYKGEEKVNG